jgi:pyridoxamine 5'-phosphate oxidase
MKIDFKKDPFTNFLESFHRAELKSQSIGLENHNAMTLSTVKDNKPTSRNVLFKGLVRGGFSFYTHYDGRKGSQIAENNNVSAHFYWPYLDHQIAIKGKAIQLTSQESDAYFESRHRLSQIGAWASDQSQVLKSRDEFEDKVKFFENKFSGLDVVPRPKEWGGFHIIPLEIEFWFDGKGRLHERYVYDRADENQSWNCFMRYP